MVWQDLVLMLGGFAFSVALVPSIKGPNKPAWATSIMTGTALSAFAVCYFSLGLLAASLSAVLTSFLWFILFFQVVLRK